MPILGSSLLSAPVRREEDLNSSRPWEDGQLWSSSRALGAAGSPWDIFRTGVSYGVDENLVNGGRSAGTPTVAPVSTGRGHKLDADTLFLWRFNETRTIQRKTLACLGTRNLPGTAATDAKTALPVPLGPIINDSPRSMVRLFDSIDDNFVTASDGVITAACKAPLTWEFFINTPLIGGSQSLFTLGISNALVARLDIRFDGRLGYFWEITGADQLYNGTTGHTIQKNTWTHCAVVKTASTVDFYIAGALSQSLPFLAGEPNGTSSGGNIGSNLDNNLRLNAMVKDLKLTSRAKTAAEIAAAAGLVNTTFTLPVEVDTLCLWRMDESADLVFDAGPYKIPLAPTVTASTFPSPSLLGDADTTGSGIMLNGTECQSVVKLDPSPDSLGYGIEILRQTLVGTQGWTFECWYKLAEPVLQTCGLFCFGNTGNTTAKNNFLTIDVTANRNIQFWSEYGTDLDSTITSSTQIPLGTHHLALRREVSVGGFHNVSIFVDGVLTDTLTTVVNFANGDAVDQPLVIGYGATEAGNPWYGFLDDVRISRIPRTNAEILESYKRGVDANVGPFATVVSPAALSQITASTPITFTVSDADTTVASVNSITVFFNDGASTIVYNGSVFAAGYLTSGISVLSGVYTVVLRKDAGWTQAITRIQVGATDALTHVGTSNIGGWTFGNTGPVITVVSTPATRLDPFVIRVYDDLGLQHYELSCQDSDDHPRQVVWDPQELFYHPFGGRSTRTGSGTLADPHIFTVYRRGGWPTNVSLDFKVIAIDSSAQETIA